MTARRASWVAMRRVALVAALLAGVVACARPVMPVASPDDATRAAQSFPGITADELAQGRQLYIARCSSCHQPVHPAAVRAADWPGHVDEMSERANLEGTQRELVVRYLVTMADAPAR